MPTDDEITRRFDAQDEVLSEILKGMAAHREYHRLIDPAVAETVDILKGAKAVKIVLAWAIGTLAAGAAAWAWIVDHLKVTIK
jgi:hypothetical protein